MSENSQEHADTAGVPVDTLKLAAWLRLNGIRLLSRSMLPDGHICYYFEPSQNLAPLIAKWHEKAEVHRQLSRFASLVSFEIRTAIKLRRAHGLPTRLVSVDDYQSSPAGTDQRAENR